MTIICFFNSQIYFKLVISLTQIFEKIVILPSNALRSDGPAKNAANLFD